MKNILKVYGYIFIILFSLSIRCIFAQSEPKWRWARTGSDATIDLSVSDTLGNTYVFGTFTSLEFSIGQAHTFGLSTGESNNLYLVKYSSTGSVLWLKSIAGQDPNTVLKPVKISVNESGDVSLLGLASNTPGVRIDNTIVNFSNTNEQMFVAKFHKAGRLLWARIVQLRGNQNAKIAGNDLVMSNQGEVFVTGNFIADTAVFNSKPVLGHTTDPLFFLVKYNSFGLIEWAQTCMYDINGDNGAISGEKVVLDNSSNIIIAGKYYGYRRFFLLADTIYSEGLNDIFLAKYAPDGSPLWIKKIFGKSDELLEQLMVSTNDEIFVSGLFNSSNIQVVDQIVTNSSAAYDLFITKLNPDGDCKWAKNIDIKISTLDFPGQKLIMQTDEKPDVYVASLFQGDAVYANTLKIPNAEPGAQDLLFLKLDGETGDPIWVKTVAGAGSNYLNSVAFDKLSNIYFTTDLNVNNLVSAEVLVKDTLGFGGNYIAKINRSSGNVGFVKPLLNRDSVSSMNIKALSLDFFGNLYVSGIFNGANLKLDNLPFDIQTSGIFTAKFAYVTTVSGHVKKSDGTPITTGYVKVYGFTRFQRAPVSDSVDINPDGSYIFNNIPLGRYIIFAKARKLDFPNVSPTYFPDVSYWEDATPVLINNTVPVTDIDITVNLPSSLTGSNILGGNVSESDTLVFSKSSLSIMKAPSKSVSIVLVNRKKSTLDGIVAVVYTDENGDFIISNVPDGWYTLLADVPGLPHYNTYDVYVTDGQYVGNLYYELGLEEIYAVNEITSTQNIEDREIGISYYPNPCKNYFNIILSDQFNTPGTMIVELFNVTGQVIKTICVENPEFKNTLDISSLKPGVYIVHTEFEGVKYIRKLLKY